ncbi:PE-PGRS family protein [Telluribacter sp. SYSU D00476]|uniref:PE-PGRS family protein n=1 Tax=Telluribacter sp. SYSU D00476 TaxID=2811430 RepID=UPI001FF54693|nr:PE-PGRS family protein [Telluribacter sp. SYSU D00476]
MKSTTRVPINKTLTILSLPVLLLAGCWEKPIDPDPDTGRSSVFETVPQRIPIEPGLIDEASGLAYSRTLDGYLWAHNDDGNLIGLIKKDGGQIRRYTMGDLITRDWEDIAVGSGPRDGVSYLYMADFGNNNADPSIDISYIYRVPELTSLEGSFQNSDIERIMYRYPDSPRDAETLLFDPITKDLFVVSKELGTTNMYRLPYPQPAENVMTAEKVGTIPSVMLATGGDISYDGLEILIRTYTSVYYWKRNPNETVAQTLSQPPHKSLPYVLEPQGEAVCFDKDAQGYYTLGERSTAPSVTLNYFKRK